MYTRWLFLVSILVALLCFPPQWYPMALRVQLGQWFGADDYRALPEGKIATDIEAEILCPLRLQVLKVKLMFRIFE